MSSNPSTRAPQPPGGGSDLSWTLRAVRNHKGLVLAFVVVGAVLALVLAFTATAKYTGVATVRVDPVNIAVPTVVRPSDQVSMQTESSVAASRRVADRAAAALEKEGISGFTGDGLRDATQVTVPSNSLVMRISVTESSSERAVAGANAMADAYLADRRADAQAHLNATRAGIVSRIRASSGTSDQAVQERLSLNNQLAGLSGVATIPGSKVSEARGPVAATSPAWWKLLLGGVVLGGIVGFFAAILRERTDPRLRHPETVAGLVNAPVRRISDQDELFDGFATALLSRDGAVETANTVALLSTSKAAGHYVAGVFERVAEAENIDLTRRSIALSSTGRVRGYRPIKSAVVLVDATTTTDAVQARTASDTATAVLVVTPVTTRRRLTRLLDALERESATIDVVMFADNRVADGRARPSSPGPADDLDDEAEDVLNGADDGTEDPRDDGDADITDRDADVTAEARR